MTPAAWAMNPRCDCGGPLMLAAEHPRDEELLHPLVCLGCEASVDGTSEQVERAATAALARLRMLDRAARWTTRHARRARSSAATGAAYTARRERRSRQLRLRF